MKLGISSYTFSWAIGISRYPLPATPLSAMGLLEKAIGYGESVLQVADNLPLTSLSPEDLNAFERRASDVGIAIEIGTRGIEPENLRAYLRLAARFGSPFVRVVVDKGEDEPTPDECIAQLKPLLPEFDDAGVKLAIENHDRFPARTLREIVETLGTDRVGICLDTVNSFGSLEGPEVVVETLAPYVVNLHVKDFTIRRVVHQMGFIIEGAPAGQGRLNIPWLMRQLPGDISAVLELWTPYQENTPATVALEAQWADESVNYLKNTLGES